MGLKDFDVTNWYGVVAPAATPKELVARLNTELNRIVQIPDTKARLDELGTRLNPMSPEQFAEFLRAEIAKYTKVISQTGVRME